MGTRHSFAWALAHEQIDAGRAVASKRRIVCPLGDHRIGIGQWRCEYYPKRCHSVNHRLCVVGRIRLLCHSACVQQSASRELTLAIFCVVESELDDVCMDCMRHGGVVATRSTHYCYSLSCVLFSCWLNLSCCCDRVSFIASACCCVVGSSSALLHLGSRLLLLKNSISITIHTRACSIGVW